MAFLEPVQFQGSAQSVGFNPVAITSPTEAIARNQASQLQSLESSLAMERQQLDRVNSVKVNNQNQLVNQLAFFSESLSTMLVEQAERQNQQDMEDGLMQAYLDGIDPAESMAFDIAEGYLKDNDDQIQGIGDQAQMSGAPFMGVQKIRELSGWKGYGYAMGMAQGAGARYASFMEEALADVPTDATPSEKAVYLSNARSHFLRQSGLMGMNPALLNKYAFPGMREADSVFLNRWRKQQEEEIKGQMIDEAQTIVGADGVGNFSKALDLMVRGGMDRRKARNELLGMLNPDEVDNLASTMSWDGKLTWEEKYPNDFRQARRNAITSEVADYDSEQAAAALEGKQWFDQVQEQWEKEPPSAADIEAAERFMSDNFNYVDSRLGDRWKGRTTDADAKAYQMDQFDRYDRAGQLTEGMLNAPDVHRDVRNTYLQRAQAQDNARRNTPEFKQYIKQIEADLKTHSGQNALDEIGKAGLELAVASAQSRFQRNMMAAINGTASPEEAARNAYAQFRQDLQNSAANPGGLYYVDDNKGFINVLPKGYTTNWFEHKAAIDAVIKENKISALDRNALIPLATLEDAMKNINSPNYQYPPIAQYLSDRFSGDITPWEILSRQAKARGLGELPMNPRLQSQVQGLSPEMVRLLTYKPTYNRTVRAFASTGTFNPDVVPRGYGGIVQQAAAKYGIDPSILAGVLEVESNFNPKARSGAGAQGIAQIMPGYHPGVNTWNANESIMYAAKYLSELRGQLGSMDEAIYAYNGGPGGIRKSAENRAYHPKVMRAAAKYGFNSGGGSPWRNPALLNPRIAYITGNIGPTSTGPHLDVKQSDGKDFAASSLDRYVEVDDPEYGRVPLSRVGVTADAANHRRRGSHGIDYGTHSGTKVYLKGGARVIGSVKTEHGDKLTIQLPNGKKYTFLHGRSA